MTRPLTIAQFRDELRNRIATAERDRAAAEVRLDCAQARLGALRDALDLAERLTEPPVGLLVVDEPKPD